MRRILPFLSLAALLVPAALAADVEKTQGVYVTLLSALKADVGETAAKAESSLKGAGFEILGSFENGVPAGCGEKARTIVFASPAWSSEVLTGGGDKAFGLPLRLAVYGDAAGVHVALVNPVSLLRTFYASNGKDASAQKAVDAVAAALAPLGPVSHRHSGQLRDTGAIGGMGGGAFPEKIVPVLTSAKPPAEVAEALKAGIAEASGWHAVYLYKASEDVFVVGLTNAKTEGRQMPGDIQSEIEAAVRKAVR